MQDKGNNTQGRETKKRKMSKKKKVLISVLSLLLLIIIGAGGAYMYIRGKVYDDSTKVQNVDYKEQSGITNILLIGTDARKVDEAARADAIIIATIDSNHKKLKLTSIMRDTLVKIPGHGEQKINAALAFGGPDLLMQTIKDNFDLILNKYVMVNFKGFQSIINQVGGIDVDVHDYEIKELNKFIGEYEKNKSPKITKPGMQHLDGQQALAYARIRKVGDGDYERTERQRRVIDLVTQKFKDLSVLKYPSVMSDLLPYVKTNIEPAMILNYAYTVSKFPSLKFEQLRIPVSEDISWGGLYKAKGWVLIVDKEQNAKMMHDFIFDDIKPTSKSYSISKWKDKLATYMNQNEDHIKENGPLKATKDDEGYVKPVRKKNNTGLNNNINNGSGTTTNKRPTNNNTPASGSGNTTTTDKGNKGESDSHKGESNSQNNKPSTGNKNESHQNGSNSQDKENTNKPSSENNKDK